MAAQKNFCSVCNRNFVSEQMFNTHRIGLYPSENKGVSTRRCMPDEEMRNRGWILQPMDVKTYVDGHVAIVKMDTWVTQGYLNKIEAAKKNLKGQF